MATELAFLQGTDATADLTTYTFASQNLGAAAADRHIVVCVQSRKGAGALATVSSVSVGGVSAVIVAQTSRDAGTGVNTAGIAIAAVPTGTTGDVVVTFSVGMLRCVIQLYRATGLDSATPADSGVSNTASQDPTFALDVPEDGCAVGCAAIGGGSGTTATWTGLTEDYDAITETFFSATSASAEFASQQTGLTVTVNFTDQAAPVGVFASWGPAGEGEVTPVPVFRRHYQLMQTR